MTSSLSTTSLPPGPAFLWAGSKILQGKELAGELWSFGIFFCGFCMCPRQDSNHWECFLLLISVFPDSKNIWMDEDFFLPFLLKCLCGHRQLMKQTKDRQCWKMIGKEKGNTVQTSAFCYYNAIFSLVRSPYCSLHWLFTGHKKFIKWLFILQYQYVSSQIVHSLLLIFFETQSTIRKFSCRGATGKKEDTNIPLMKNNNDNEVF